MDAQTIAALVGLVVTLGGALAWVIRTILTQTIPGIHAAHTQDVDKLCATFSTAAEKDRALYAEQHKDLVEKIDRLAVAQEKGTEGILEYLQRQSAINGAWVTGQVPHRESLQDK